MVPYHEHTTTPNKILLMTTKGQLPSAHEWANTTLPKLYNQHNMDKIDVMTLQHLTPQCLDKMIITSASETYADKLKHHTS